MNDFPKEKLLNLDDESFKALILEINALAGGNIKNAEKLSADIPSLKNQISKMNERDAKRLMQKVGDEKADEILKKLGRL